MSLVDRKGLECGIQLQDELVQVVHGDVQLGDDLLVRFHTGALTNPQYVTGYGVGHVSSYGHPVGAASAGGSPGIDKSGRSA